jgi:hypothetical protein
MPLARATRLSWSVDSSLPTTSATRFRPAFTAAAWPWLRSSAASGEVVRN